MSTKRFLAFVLAFAMVFSLGMPSYAFAEGEVKVARVGSETYTLQGAFDQGGTVELFDDSADPATVTKNTVLNGSGHTLSGTITVNNGAELTLANVKLTNNTSIVVTSGKLVVEDATVSAKIVEAGAGAQPGVKAGSYLAIDSALLADGYQFAGGSVGPVAAEAMIGTGASRTYDSFANLANSGETIKLLQNVGAPYALAYGKTLTVNLNGKTVSVVPTDAKTYIVKDNTVDGLTTYTVAEGTAKVAGGDLYETFAEAAAVANGAIIGLLKNIAEPYTLSEGETLNVKQNGKELTVLAPEKFGVKVTTSGDVTTYTLVPAVWKVEGFDVATDDVVGATFDPAAGTDSLLTVTDAEINFSPADPAIGRPAGYAWVGAKFTAPAAVTETDAKTVSKVKIGSNEYLFTDIADDADKTFFTVWFNVTVADVETALQTPDKAKTWDVAFDWNGDGEYDQTITVKLVVSNIKLNNVDDPTKIEIQVVNDEVVAKNAEYTVTFHYIGDSGSEKVAPVTVQWGKTVTKAAPAPKGYEWGGWFLDEAFTQEFKTGADGTVVKSDLDVYAKQTPIVYTISYANDPVAAEGEEIVNNNPVSYTVEDADFSLEAPTRVGYTFKGWVPMSRPDETPAETKEIKTSWAANLGYIAKWEANGYNLVFHANGGKLVKSDGTEAEVISAGKLYGTDITGNIPADPTRDGYTFAGWFEQGSDVQWGTESNPFPGTMPAFDLIVIAKWDTDDYTVKFDTDGGSEVADQTVPFGETITKPEDPTKEGYTFDKWVVMPAETEWNFETDTVDTANDEKTLTLTATYTLNAYTITFKFDNGEEDKVVELYYGKAIITYIPKDFTKEGYEFQGWDKEIPETMPAENLVVTALWDSHHYPITYNLDEGALPEGKTNPDFYTVDQDDFVLVNPVKEGYTFAGWTGTDLEAPTMVVTIPKGSTGDRAYTATWTVNNYNLTFNVGEGKFSDDANEKTHAVPFGTKFETYAPAASEFARTGYNFAEWDTDLAGTMPAEDTTITALWTATPYEIKYTLGEGAVNAEANPASYTIEDAEIKLAAPTREGYVFAGWTWYGQTEPTMEATIPAGSTGTKAFTAHWAIVSVTKNPGEDKFDTMEAAIEYQAGSTLRMINLLTDVKFDVTDDNLNAVLNKEFYVADGEFTLEITVPATYAVVKTAGEGFTTYKVVKGIAYVVVDPVLDENFEPIEGTDKVYFGTIDDAVAFAAGTKEIAVVGAAGEYTLSEDEVLIVKKDGNKGSLTIKAPEGFVVIPGGEPTATIGATATTYKLAKLHTVTYEFDGGKAAKNEVITETANSVTAGVGQPINAPTKNPTKTGWTFDGWYVGEDKYNDTLPTVMPEEDITFTAHWSKNSVTITVKDVDGETDLWTASGEFGDAVVAPELTKDGYDFAGYTKTAGGTTAATIPATFPASNLTVYASWTLVNYNLTYELDGGTASNPKTYNVESKPITLKNPTKTGYTFAGWTGTDLEAPTMVVTIPTGSLGDRTFTATWTINSYKVSFDTKGGNEIDPQLVVFGEKISVEAPTKEGYTFGGWKNGTEKVDLDTFTMPAQEITLTAVWTANKYTFTFDGNEGTVVVPGLDEPEELPVYSFEAAYGSKIDSKTDVEAYREGYNFVGWFDENDVEYGTEENPIPEKMPLDGLKLIAKWEIRKIAVIMEDYYTEDGSVYTIVTSQFGEPITYPTPTLEGFEFIGYVHEDDIEDVDNYHPIGFEDNNICCALSSELTPEDIAHMKVDIEFNPATVADGENTDWPTGTDLEHLLIDWPEAADYLDCDGYYYVVAIWQAKEYTVSYDFDGGSAKINEYTFVPDQDGDEGAGHYDWVLSKKAQTELTVTADCGTPISYPAAPTKAGFTFGGWADEEGNIVTELPKTMPAGGLKLTAQWGINEYKITFDPANDEAKFDLTFDFGEEIEAPADPTKTGYTFKGWTPALPETMPAKNLSVTANWEINKYKLVFDADGGTFKVGTKEYAEPYEFEAEYDASVAANKLPSDPEKEGYNFLYWLGSDGKQYQKADLPTKMPLDGLTFTAQYEVQKIAILIYDTKDTVKVVTANFGETVEYPTPDAIEGYDFLGYIGADVFEADPEFNNGTATDNLKSYWIENALNANVVLKSAFTDKTLAHLKLDVPELAPTTFPEYMFENKVTEHDIIEHPELAEYKDCDGIYVVYAMWRAQSNEVVYDVNEGTWADTAWTDDVVPNAEGVVTITADTGVAIVTPAADPTKSGSNFLGWANEEGTIVSKDNLPAVMPAGGLNLTAQWGVNQYTVTFKPDNGEADIVSTFDFGAAIEAPADPVKEGYTFDGWYRALPETMPARNLTVTAQWKINQYTLTFDLNGGVMGDKDNVVVTADFDSDITGSDPQNGDPTKTNYKFQYWLGSDGEKYLRDWFEDSETHEIVKIELPEGFKALPYKMPAEDMTFTAQWEIRKIAIIFMDAQPEDEDFLDNLNYQIVDAGSVINYPTPELDGFDFLAYVDMFDEGSTELESFLDENGNDKPENIFVLKSSFTDKDLEKMKIKFPWMFTTNVPDSYMKPADAEMSEQDIALFLVDHPELEDILSCDGVYMFYAMWRAQSATVTYDANGGKVKDGDGKAVEKLELVADTGMDIFAPAKPTFAGHTFTGWSDEEGKIVELDKLPTTMPAGGAKFTAVWDINAYELSFDSNNGTEVESQTVIYGEKAVKPEDPTREGFTFAGWFLGEKEWNFDEDVVTKKTELKAAWERNEYVLTFDGNGGSLTVDGETFTSLDVKVPFNKSLTVAVADPEREGYTFDGWFIGEEEFKADSFKMPANDVTVTAKWTANTYKAYFYTEGGVLTVDEEEFNNTYVTEVVFENNVEDPGVPVKAGYTFNGWAIKSKDAKGNDVFIPVTFPTPITVEAAKRNFYAQWEIETYTVTYDFAGGEKAENGTYPETFKVTDSIVVTNPVREGYTFKTWTVEKEGSEPATSNPMWINGLDCNLKLTAVWEANTNNIWFVLKDDTTSFYTITAKTDEEISAELKDKAVEEAAKLAPAGYEFDKWDVEIPDTMPTKSMSIIPEYKIISYTVTFDSDGGSDVASQTIKYNDYATKPADPEKEGYKFGGWFLLDENGNMASKKFDFTAEAIKGNSTLKAKWTPKTMDIFFVDGTTMLKKALQVKVGDPITEPDVPSKAGYRYEWTPEFTGKVPYDESGELVYSVNWIKVYSISVVENNKVVATISDLDEGTVLGTVEYTKEGFELVGWKDLSGNDVPASTKIVEDLTLVPVWKEAEEQPEPTEAISFTHSVTLSENLNLNYYFSGLKEGTDAKDYTVRVTFNGQTKSYNLAADTALDDYGYGEEYKLVAATIYAFQMTLPVKVEVEYNGEVIATDDYSVQQYFESRLEKSTDEAFRNVCKAALDYGANAQLYFKEDTGNLANKNSNPSNTLTATRPTNVKATAGSVEAIDPSTVSRSLIFGSETSIKVYFKLKEGAKIEDLSFTCKGFNVTEPVQEGSEYSVKITGIRSFELYKDFDLVISQGSSSMTVTYSPYAYANSKWESTTANLANLVKAMVAYGDAAKAIWG